MPTGQYQKARTWLKMATELLVETLSNWEGEEDSVKDEKADHIADLERFLADLPEEFK